LQGDCLSNKKGAEMIFSGIKQNDRLILTNLDKYKEFIDKVPEGQLMSIEVKRKRERITDPQRSYLHLSLRWLGKEIGLSEDDTKTAMKEMFFYDVDIYQKTGLKVPLSTEKQTTKAVAGFINDIDEWAVVFLGYALPPPQHINEAIRSQR
jgi:hypothetical protein